MIGAAPLRAVSGEPNTEIMGSVERVLETGPIPYRSIVLCGDPDLEHGLRNRGVEPETTSYRLIELPVPSITDTVSVPHRVWDRSLADAGAGRCRAAASGGLPSPAQRRLGVA